MARFNQLQKDQKLKKEFLELQDGFLENFDSFWQILDESSQKQRGRPLPLVLKIALKQHFKEQATRLAILMRGNTFTFGEALEVLPELAILACGLEEKEKLEKILLAVLL